MVRPFTDAGDGITGTWGDPALVKAQAEHKREIVTTADDVRAVSLLTLRVPPKTGLDLGVLFATDSEVVYGGHSSWVLTTEPVLRQGVLVFQRVTTGDRRPAGGGWATTVDISHSAGRDRDGNPTPATVQADVPAIFIPRSTTETTDFTELTESRADVLLPSTVTVRSTARILIDETPMAGTWSVDGDPSPDHGRLKVPVRRS